MPDSVCCEIWNCNATWQISKKRNKRTKDSMKKEFNTENTHNVNRIHYFVNCETLRYILV